METLRTLTAKCFLRRMPNSSTGALLIICNDGKEYVLKHPGNPYSEQGANILIAEYLSYLFATRFNLPIPEYCFITIAEDFIAAIEDEAIASMLQNSPPVCIGSRFIHGTLPFAKSLKLNTTSHKLLFRTILGLDQYLYNGDRFPSNPNILFIPQNNELRVIDYSLAIWPIRDTTEDVAAPLEFLENHILFSYATKNKSYIASLIKDIYNATIDNYLETIPEPWFTEDLSKYFLKKFLTIRRDNIDKILKGDIGCQNQSTINLSLL